MAVKLYVGNLSYQTTSDGLSSAFAPFGTVVSATVITDKYSGRSKGFGFVEFESEDEANAAIEGMNEKDLDGRQVRVNVARPREERPSRE